MWTLGPPRMPSNPKIEPDSMRFLEVAGRSSAGASAPSRVEEQGHLESGCFREHLPESLAVHGHHGDGLTLWGRTQLPATRGVRVTLCRQFRVHMAPPALPFLALVLGWRVPGEGPSPILCCQGPGWHRGPHHSSVPQPRHAAPLDGVPPAEPSLLGSCGLCCLTLPRWPCTRGVVHTRGCIPM